MDTSVLQSQKSSSQIIGCLQDDVARSLRLVIDKDASVECLQNEAVNLKLEHAMMAELGTRNIVSEELNRLLRMTSTFVELLFQDCTWEEKINLALYTWVMFYADDLSPWNPQPLLEFQSRFFRGQTQLDPILDMLADVLHKMHDQYPPFSIHFFITATFEYLTINCVEPHLEALNASVSETEPNMPVMKPMANLRRFAGFLRDKSGLGVGTTLAAYPHSRKVDFTTLIQTLPDMGFWITACNDAFSFYKEALQGEATAYIPSRARAENRTEVQVLKSLVNEMVEASENVEKILKDRDLGALKTWKTVERGFIGWHLIEQRYRLDELRIFPEIL